MPSASKANACPACGRPAASPHAPFCGQGCKDRDLLQWLSDGHRIPGPALDPESLEGLDRADDPSL